jgi:hypothetical protein
MDPQMSAVLAGRIALERLTPPRRETGRPSADRPRTLARLTQAMISRLHRRGDVHRPPVTEGAFAKSASGCDLQVRELAGEEGFEPSIS